MENFQYDLIREILDIEDEAERHRRLSELSEEEMEVIEKALSNERNIRDAWPLTEDTRSTSFFVEPPPVTYGFDVFGRSEQIRKSDADFIRDYSLDIPSTLYSKARQVLHSEPSTAGFAFEDFLAGVFCYHFLNDEDRVNTVSQFLLHKFISGTLESSQKAWYLKYLPEKTDTLFGKYPGPLDLPSKSVFLEYCAQRIPGIGKPAGGTQTVGPDLCMWLMEDVFMALGSKISKKAYDYTRVKTAAQHTRRPADLIVDRSELLDNVFSLELNNYGVTRSKVKKAGTSMENVDRTFANQVKNKLFIHRKPLKLYIQVNVVLPFYNNGTETSNNEKEYAEAVNPIPVLSEASVDIDGREYKYYIVRVNITSDNAEASGIFGRESAAVDAMKTLFINSINDLRRKTLTGTKYTKK